MFQLILPCFHEYQDCFARFCPISMKKCDLCVLKKWMDKGPVMDSDGQLPITAHQWSFLNNGYNVRFVV